MTELVAVRGDELELWTDDGINGVVRYVRTDKFSPPLKIQSILARGYWEDPDYMRKDRELDEETVLKELRANGLSVVDFANRFVDLTAENDSLKRQLVKARGQLDKVALKKEKVRPIDPTDEEPFPTLFAQAEEEIGERIAKRLLQTKVILDERG